MMPLKKQFSHLQHTDHNSRITEQTHYEFLYRLQSALLLALQEQGRLNAITYRQATQALRSQRLARARLLLSRESQP